MGKKTSGASSALHTQQLQFDFVGECFHLRRELIRCLDYGPKRIEEIGLDFLPEFAIGIGNCLLGAGGKIDEFADKSLLMEQKALKPRVHLVDLGWQYRDAGLRLMEGKSRGSLERHIEVIKSQLATVELMLKGGRN